ncbi:hypothetical protein HYH03_012060 [Edaphochlamys debaryana]|uniref:Uncharacterized protein n=1 Tax=Edaphochlamys debaryana TaxID=47281 RepID=A0A835XQT8_9CHLO|nr:hypothetical protein HYH03_012060 [Edaphochlamys debaryana]|eukprot:KAG2489422.1 hypothetical protein HYH03_012060 [Edaphochlamys debaryana]
MAFPVAPAGRSSPSQGALLPPLQPPSAQASYASNAAPGLPSASASYASASALSAPAPADGGVLLPPASVVPHLPLADPHHAPAQSSQQPPNAPANAPTSDGSGAAANYFYYAGALPNQPPTYLGREPYHHHYPPGAGAQGGAAATQTTHAVQQAALRKQVQKDIKRMLGSNKAYTAAVKGPPVLTAEALDALAKPRARPGTKADLQSLVDIPDPVDWARWKTEQLAIGRLTAERAAAGRQGEKERQAEALAAYRAHKAELEAARAEAKQRTAAAEAEYGKTMSAWLNRKGQVELEEFKSRRDDDREARVLDRGRRVRGTATHDYYVR